MKKKINIALLFGGRSFEHQVSLLSARSVLKALDLEKYHPILIGIDPEGAWHQLDQQKALEQSDNPKAISLGKSIRRVENIALEEIDVAFPILHGPNGEDGTVQGLLTLANVPYVGADVLGSAIGMDKEVAKRLLVQAGLEVAPWVCIKRHERPSASFKKTGFSIPVFVKPATAGSSIGVSKVEREEQFEAALDLAFQYSQKVLVEQAIVGREINCGVIGNEYPIVSLPCEIKPKGLFHSYESKYLDPQGAEFHIPAKVTPEELTTIQQAALATYGILSASGMARVDLFLTPDGRAIINEINTIPGLTHQSPFARMWDVTGISFPELLDRLITLALDRHKKQSLLTLDYKKEEVCISIPSTV